MINACPFLRHKAPQLGADNIKLVKLAENKANKKKCKCGGKYAIIHKEFFDYGWAIGALIKCADCGNEESFQIRQLA